MILPNSSPVLADVIEQIVFELTKIGISNPIFEARQLVIDATTICSKDFILQPQMKLVKSQMATISAWLERRKSGESLARIRGWQEFYGRKFVLSSETLEPRSDSETLIDVALQIMEMKRGPRHAWRILDIGTGTGCLILTLLAERSNATAVGVDICSEALVIAQKNAIHLGLESRVTWLQSDYLKKVNGQFDLLISNPPYIKSQDISSLQIEIVNHDPRLALDGGPDGLNAYRSLAADLKRVVPQGFAVFESACNDTDRVIEILKTGENHNFLKLVSVNQDLTGCKRCVVLETIS
ncbi:MAG: Release factor glutamine methyltransferase [Hyphomicrobiaceae bacterium hypho_1]